MKNDHEKSVCFAKKIPIPISSVLPIFLRSHPKNVMNCFIVCTFMHNQIFFYSISLQQNILHYKIIFKVFSMTLTITQNLFIFSIDEIVIIVLRFRFRLQINWILFF